MSNAIYAALSRQTALDRELSIIANNVANASTTGFRREEPIFTEYVRGLIGSASLSETRIGAAAIGEEQGEFIETKSPLDIAIEGPGWFQVETPRGERLTRAGTFVRAPDGALATPDGYRLSGDGGAIQIPLQASRVIVAEDGTVSADGTPIGRIALFDANPTTLSREGETLFRTSGELTAIENPKVRQGFVEASNVNAVSEIARLIEVQRAFEMSQQLANDEDDRIRRAIETLGGGR